MGLGKNVVVFSAGASTMSKADPTISAREMRYRKRQAERGLKYVRVWVPEDKVDMVKEFAKKLRDASSGSPPE